MAHYIHDEKNNRIEGMSKEEIYALLAEAIQEGELPSVDEDTAFVTMFKSIVDGKAYKMGFCTQAQYNQLEAQGLLVADTYYIITDDTTYDDIIAYIDNKETSLLENISTKVAINFNNGDIENNITNGETGVKIEVDRADADENTIVNVKSNEIIIGASATDAHSTLNVGQGSLSISTGVDDDGVQINLSSYDAVISRTVDGNYETKSLFKKLYRHDFKLTRTGGGAYVVYFSLYLASATAVTTFSDLMSYIGTNNHLNANGEWLDSTYGLSIIENIWTGTSLNELNVGYLRLQNGAFDYSNGGFSENTIVISDKVTQVY